MSGWLLIFVVAHMPVQLGPFSSNDACYSAARQLMLIPQGAGMAPMIVGVNSYVCVSQDSGKLITKSEATMKPTFAAILATTIVLGGCAGSPMRQREAMEAQQQKNAEVTQRAS
jgi:hypothetical protein